MAFKYDYEYLIHLIYCTINDLVPEEKSENISFENVFELGKTHEVANIAFLSVDKLNNKPEDELYNEWQIFYYHSVQRDARQEAEREKIVSNLHSFGIRTLEAQGTVTKTLYPSSELRMMSDIDFIIDEKNLIKAREIMISLGYTVDEPKEGEFNAFNEKNMEIEFHTEFFTKIMYSKKNKFFDAVNNPFEHLAVDGLSCELDKTYFYLYSVLHTLKHFETAGCGIRRILDLYYLKTIQNEVDMKLVLDVLEKNGFIDEYELLFELEEYWFENKKPRHDLSSVIRDIILSGNHGSYQIQLEKTFSQNKKSGVKFPRLKMIMSIIYPSKYVLYEGHPEFEEKGYSRFKSAFLRVIYSLKPEKFTALFRRIKQFFKV